MKIKLLLLLFLASLSSFAQYTLIPDVNFEKKLIALGYDSGTVDGKVLTTNISSMTSLDVANRSIANLTGIQDFVALNTLNCDGNQLTALDVSKNTALTYLDCRNNKLASLDVSKNIHLKRLECYGNQLTTLDVSKNTALTSLDCLANRLTSLNLKNGNNINIISSSINFLLNPDLSCIQVDDAAYSNANWATKKDATTSYSTDCSSVQYTLIPDLNFEKKLISLEIDSGTPNGKVLTDNISSLTYLNVSSSSITNLTGIQDFVSLQSLDCSYNQLTSLDLSKNVALTSLDCYYNQLTALDLSKNTALTELRCYTNKLTSLGVSNNTALKNIHCGENQLNSLNVFNNIALTELSCYRNALTALDVSKNTALTNLDCSRSTLTALDVSKNTALIYLDCSLNKLTALDVSKNTALTYLDCNLNKLTALDFSKNISLSNLSCEDNQLNTLNVSNNITLTEFRCSGSQLTALDVSKNTALKLLACSENELTALDVSKNTLLKSLFCDNNQLTNLDVSKNIALTTLECSYNKLINLNLKNGNNVKLDKNTDYPSSYFAKNPNLICIQVDDIAYAKANWASKKDVTADYSTDCSSVGQFTLIPDVNFEKKLISLGIDSGTSDGKVPTFKVSGVTSLDISNSSITNLTGIQDFVALQSLNCKGNQLTALDVSKNIALKYLHCYQNQLTLLDVSKNTALEQLTCYSNKLTSLDVSNNAALTTLHCYSNQLTALDVSKDIALKTLHCYSNQLTILNVSQNVALAELHCYSNKLTSFDVSKSIALTKLYCYSNQLTALDVSKNLALIELYCYSNQLTALDVSKNTVLKYIDCNSNQLTSLNVKNGNNSNFSKYNFTNNPNLSCIQADSVNSFSNLYKDATATYSTDCSAFTIIPDVNFEKKLISLGIDFGTPDGKVLTAKLSLVNDLDVSSSSIADLTGIQDFRHLKTLHCENNQLRSLDVSNSFALLQLYCSQNQLTALDVSKNTALVYLFCYSNQLTTLDVSKNIALTWLECYNNQITALDISKNTGLIRFYCQNNKLTSLNLQNGKNAWLIDNSDYKNNPDLSCIKVDNFSYFNAYWATAKDATANYSYDCSAVEVSSSFEDQLIALGIDNIKNGSVLLSSISNVTTLDVSYSGITDLSGIEYFSDLETLNCQGNLLTSINVSSNLALKYLDCSTNPLSALDVSKNTQLTELYCDGIITTTNKINNKTSAVSQLTVLDVSKNVLLIKLSCSNNQIVSLDLSKNTLLIVINCSNNKLASLNLSNGNNNKLAYVNLKTNAPLSCILVDDTAYANANWSTAKDATAIYSKTACTLGIEDVVFDKIAVYPNPTKGELHIDNIVLEKASVYDALGKLVTTTKFTNGSNTNSINLSGFPKGIYYVYLESEGSTVVKKIIVK